MEKGKLSLKIEELEDRIAPVVPGHGLGTAITADPNAAANVPSPFPASPPSDVNPGAGTGTV